MTCTYRPTLAGSLAALPMPQPEATVSPPAAPPGTTDVCPLKNLIRPRPTGL